jgi:hypothetical protein
MEEDMDMIDIKVQYALKFGQIENENDVVNIKRLQELLGEHHKVFLDYSLLRERVKRLITNNE